MFRVYWISADGQRSIEMGNSRDYAEAQAIAGEVKRRLIAEGEDGDEAWINAGTVTIDTETEEED